MTRYSNPDGSFYADGISLNDEDKIDLLAANGKLIKRPIAIADNKASVGFKEETYIEIWQS